MSARVLNGELEATAMADGRVFGRAIYETQQRSGRFLETDFLPASTLLWATVDNAPVVPMRSAEGKWLIPLAERSSNRVCLGWNQRLTANSTGGWSLSLPRVGSDRVPTLVTACLPVGLTLNPLGEDLEASVPERFELERAYRTARQISEFVSQMDRRSARDRDRLVSLVIAHELSLRSAERSWKRATRGGNGIHGEGAQRDLETIQSTRKALTESLRAAKLEKEIEAAQLALGALQTGTAAALSAPEPMTPDRFRKLGQPTFWIGQCAGLDEDRTTMIGSNASTYSEAETRDRARTMLMLGFLAAMGVMASMRAHPATTICLILAGVLGLAGFLGGPIVLAIAVALIVAGYLSGTRGLNPTTTQGSALVRGSRPVQSQT
jgi:hypothetical protein